MTPVHAVFSYLLLGSWSEWANGQVQPKPLLLDLSATLSAYRPFRSVSVSRGRSTRVFVGGK